VRGNHSPALFKLEKYYLERNSVSGVYPKGLSNNGLRKEAGTQSKKGPRESRHILMRGYPPGTEIPLAHPRLE
jgi:hypothetical protein